MPLCPMCVPRNSSFSSETHQVKPPAIHRYRGTTTTAEHRESGSVLHVFFSAFRRYTSMLYPIVSATTITPSLAGRKSSNLVDLALHAVMRKTRRVSVSRHVIRTASTYLHSYHPPIPSLSPCFSMIHHRWALHHAATAPEKKLTGLAGLRSVLWSRSRRLFWPARASGRPLDEGEIDQASWGWHCCAARTFAVLHCRCPHVPVAHLLLCRHDSDSSQTYRGVDCCSLYTHLTVLCQVPQEHDVLSSTWHLFCLERCVLRVKTGLMMQSSQGHHVPPVGHPYAGSR
jgi:hypothetical protein